MSSRIDSSPSTRTPLSRDRVLRAAVDLADREGIEALSMRRLGQDLDVEAMALYRHVGSKDELLDAMVDVLLSEIDPPSAVPDWRSIMRARILSARRSLLRHPWASAVIASRKNASPRMLDYMNSMAGILRQGGFSVELTHHAMHVLGSRVIGFAQELFDDSSSNAVEPERMATMQQQLSAQYPYIGEILSQVTHDEKTIIGTGCDDQWEFEFGLDIILEGLESKRLAHLGATEFTAS